MVFLLVFGGYLCVFSWLILVDCLRLLLVFWFCVLMWFNVLVCVCLKACWIPMFALFVFAF